MVSRTNWIMYGVLAFILFGGIFILHQLGIIKTTASTTSPLDTATTPINVQCNSDTKVDLQTLIVQSIPDTTGVKQAVGSLTLAWYREGEVIPFTSDTSSSTAYVSSTNDPTWGSKVFLVASGAGYYTTKYDVETLPCVASKSFKYEIDRLNTLTIALQNSSGGAWVANNGTDTIGTDQQMRMYLRLTGATARGVYRQPMICFDYNTGNWSRIEIVGGTKVNVPSGVASGFEECYSTNIDTIKDFEEKTLTILATPQSGVNPADYIVGKVIDAGATYTKATPQVLYVGPQNENTLAPIGATDYYFTINVA